MLVKFSLLRALAQLYCNSKCYQQSWHWLVFPGKQDVYFPEWVKEQYLILEGWAVPKAVRLRHFISSFINNWRADWGCRRAACSLPPASAAVCSWCTILVQLSFLLKNMINQNVKCSIICFGIQKEISPPILVSWIFVNSAFSELPFSASEKYLVCCWSWWGTVDMSKQFKFSAQL